MNHPHRLDLGVLCQLVGQGLNIHRFPPGRVYHEGLRPAALGDVGQAVAKESVAADDRCVARLQDVGAGGFHGAGSSG